MKKYLTAIVIALSLINGACSSGISDLDGDSVQITPDPEREESVAQYRYLGVLYDSNEGKQLNDEVLKGEMYDVYRDKVQKTLNLYMHFPFEAKSEGALGSIVNSIFGTPQAAINWTEIPWYDSLPQDIKDQVQQYIVDTISEGIANSIADFLDSNEGQIIVNQYLDNVQARANQVVDHGVDELADEFQDEIDTMTTVFSVSSIAAAFCGTMFVEPMGIVNLFISQTNHQQVMSKLRQIQQQLVDIQNALRGMEQKLDTILGIEMSEYFEAISAAQGLITDIYQALDQLPIEDNDGRKGLIEHYLRTSADYEKTYREAFEKVQEHVTMYESSKGIQKTPPFLTVFATFYEKDLFGNWQPNLEFMKYSIQINNPIHYTKFTLQDIALMKRMSEVRLTLAQEIYLGEQLLKYRSTVAKQDLEKLTKIKTSLNKFNAKDFCDDLFDISFSYPAGLQLGFFWFELNKMFLNDPNVKSELVLFNPQTGMFLLFDPPARKYTYSIKINNESVCTFEELFNQDSVFVSTSGDVPSSKEFLEVLRSRLEKQVYEKVFNDYYVQALTMLATWEIQLKAHIKAAEGL